jgi:hypothetical protein
MATQESVIKFKGQLGDITFYKTKDGYAARTKGGIDGERIKNDPAFERTRENGAEFSRAGKAAKLIRNALRAYILKASDSRMTSRLTRELMRVIQADAVNARGMRNVIDGESELLQGFDFNIDAKLTQSFFAPFTPSIDRVAGSALIDIPALIPAHMIGRPEGATHCRLHMIGLELDFEAGTYVINVSESPAIELNLQPLDAIQLTTPLPVNSTKPLFVGMAIEYNQVVNGQTYQLKNGAYNALSLVLVNGGGMLAEPIRQ